MKAFAITLNILILLLWGSSMALGSITLLFMRKHLMNRLTLQVATGIILATLVGSARMEGVADPMSVRGGLGIIAMALISVDLFMIFRVRGK